MKNLAVALLLVSSVNPSLSKSSEGEGTTRIPPFSSPLARLSLSAYGSDTQGDITPEEEDTASDVQARIVGGNQASAGEYPFYVQGDGCGGSLIWKDIVLTAGHCKGYWDTAWVGAYKYQSTSYGAEKISTVREVRHSDFSSKTYDWDFMIVQLSKSSNKGTIRMNTDSSNPSGSETLRVIGMGVTNENSYKDPDFLREVSVANVPASTCADKYDGEFFDTSTMMCAASPGKDSCFGDSGGPIFDGNGVQVGVVSWGIGCARSKYPGVYSRVSKGHTWIKQQVCKYSKGPPSSCGRRRRLRHRTARSLRGLATPTTPSVSVNATTTAASATCSDSDETFELFNRPDVEHDCSWLRDNRFSEGDDLCDYLHVAFRCPSTCEDCSVLSD